MTNRVLKKSPQMVLIYYVVKKMATATFCLLVITAFFLLMGGGLVYDVLPLAFIVSTLAASVLVYARMRFLQHHILFMNLRMNLEMIILSASFGFVVLFFLVWRLI